MSATATLAAAMAAEAQAAAQIAKEATDPQRHVQRTPSLAARGLESMDLAELETVMINGQTPDPALLDGWIFRGINTPDWMRLLGIKKFMKGFHYKGTRLMGFNVPVKQDALPKPWRALPNDDAPKRFGFYEVTAVDATATDNHYLHGLLLDYGKGDNPFYDPSAGLRDYLVQVDADNPDLFLGKAYFALGAARVPTFSFFILERDRPIS